jgi:DUF1680 family protein
MAYYLTTISISLKAKSDKEVADKIDKILNQIRENKDINPYVDSCKKVVITDNKRRFESIDNSEIKKLNTKK